MSRLKKILLTGISYVLVAALAIGGTLAYLTMDAGDESNVFSIGDINISLEEEVAIYGEGGEVKKTENGAEYLDIMPGDYLKKEVTVTNNGKTPAYVAVTVLLNNADKINAAIDDVYENAPYSYTAEQVQAVYDFIFDGWGINYNPRPGKTGVNDARGVIDGTYGLLEHVLQVDFAKTVKGSTVIGAGNWFTAGKEKPGQYWVDGPAAYDGYYTKNMNDYEICYTYYMYLPAGESSTLFNGLNVPAEFNNEQIKMFDGLKIDVEAKAIQADNMGVAAQYKNDPNGKAKTAFAILAGDLKGEDAGVNNTPVTYAVDTWDGTVDTSWYDSENPQTEYTITTAEQLEGLAELVSGNTTFKGVTFTLANDLDLYCEDTSENADGDPVTFRPIGDYSKGGTFEGVFDGNGKTISNLYQNGWDLGYDWYNYGSYGLFGNVNNATIKNLTLSGGESYIEGGDTSFVAGSATGTCVFENITIKDSVSATYNNGNGGIIGWSGAGNYTFKNITIAEDCVLAGLWGSFDSSIGGIVGQGEPGATYNFENVDIACRLDVYNDCTASYDYYNYRMCGMIIGRLAKTTTIDGSNYPDMSQYNITCNDVTVTYGDWANYHYCEPTPGHNGGRGMRVESGYSYDGLPADYDHSQCVTHHMNLIPFDQIFGGDQLGVKGLKTYDGVTVIYNNK